MPEFWESYMNSRVCRDIYVPVILSSTSTAAEIVFQTSICSFWCTVRLGMIARWCSRQSFMMWVQNWDVYLVSCSLITLSSITWSLTSNFMKVLVTSVVVFYVRNGTNRTRLINQSMNVVIASKPLRLPVICVKNLSLLVPILEFVFSGTEACPTFLGDFFTLWFTWHPWH